MPERGARAARTIRWLQVLYVTDRLISRRAATRTDLTLEPAGRQPV